MTEHDVRCPGCVRDYRPEADGTLPRHYHPDVPDVECGRRADPTDHANHTVVLPPVVGRCSLGEHAEQITPAFTLAADLVLFARDQRGLVNVLLIERDGDPFAGCSALPGGHVDPGETFEQAARRELAEETGLTAPSRLVQVGVYDAPMRDPRGRVISVAFAGFLSRLTAPAAGDDAAAAWWAPVDELDPTALAFDHADILRAAREAFPASRED